MKIGPYQYRQQIVAHDSTGDENIFDTIDLHIVFEILTILLTMAAGK